MTQVVSRRRASQRGFTRLVTEPAPQVALIEPDGTPRRSLRKGSKLLPGLTPRHERRRSVKDVPIDPSSGSLEQQQEKDSAGGQRMEDIRSKALGLSRKFTIDFYEVKSILEQLQKILDQHDDKGFSEQNFNQFLCKVFDVPIVEDRVVQAAYSASQFAQPPIDIEKFLDWYKINMFSDISRIKAGTEAHKSAELVRALARIRCL